MTQSTPTSDVYCAGKKPVYEITGITKQVKWPDGSNHTVRRLRYVYKPESEKVLRSYRVGSKWPHMPKYGELMGWVESKRNLGPDTSSLFYVPYIGENAVISSKYQVLSDCCDTVICDNAFLFGNVRLKGWNIFIYGNAIVGGYVELNSNSEVFGNAKIMSRDKSPITLGCQAMVFENATVFARDGISIMIGDNCRLHGNAMVSACAGNKAAEDKCLCITQWSRLYGTASLSGRVSKFSGAAMRGTF